MGEFIIAKYRCNICNSYNYDDSKGDFSLNIPLGMKPEDFPDGWQCPVCKANKTHLPLIEEERKQSNKSTVSEIMIETMINWGVDTVFGIVGHSNLGLADAIRKQEEKGNLKYIGVRHEGAASFAASAYGKLTGRPAACFSIAGPGATNMLTGLWDAKMDRAPILALLGQVNAQVLGRGFFQEIDLKSAYAAVSAWSQIVLKKSNHPELMTLAIKSAILERDVSSLIFPDEIQTEIGSSVSSSPKERITTLDITPSLNQLKDAITLLENAKRPVILVGYGAKNSMSEIITFAEKFNIPIITTFKAKGQISDSHPLACSNLGRSGTPMAVWAMDTSDLLLVLGASFSQHTEITPEKTIIQVDFDPQALAKFYKIKSQVLGEIGRTVNILNEKVNMHNDDMRHQIKEQWNEWRKEKDKRSEKNNNNGLASAHIFKLLSKHAPSNAIIALDVGNNTYSFGRYFECKEQSVLLSGYLGSIGFGYPAAMGVAAANQSRPIIAITGDGGFGQYMAEVTTAVKYKMPIKHILLNNSELGKISLEQKNKDVPIWKTELHNPNFAKYAENCGALGIRVTTKDELEAALKKLFNYDGPGIVEIISDPFLV